VSKFQVLFEVEAESHEEAVDIVLDSDSWPEGMPPIVAVACAESGVICRNPEPTKSLTLVNDPKELRGEILIQSTRRF